MSELIEYFTRHYTLVLDNDQGSYNAVRAATREAITEETPDVTLAQYVAMSTEDRATAYAYTIGASILALVEEWTDELLDEHHDTMGALLIREVLLTDGHDLAYALGEHYMPDDSDAQEFLSDHDARPDDSPEPGDRCKDCGEDITWVGPGSADWEH